MGKIEDSPGTVSFIIIWDPCARSPRVIFGPPGLFPFTAGVGSRGTRSGTELAPVPDRQSKGKKHRTRLFVPDELIHGVTGLLYRNGRRIPPGSSGSMGSAQDWYCFAGEKYWADLPGRVLGRYGSALGEAEAALERAKDAAFGALLGGFLLGSLRDEAKEGLKRAIASMGNLRDPVRHILAKRPGYDICQLSASERLIAAKAYRDIANNVGNSQGPLAKLFNEHRADWLEGKRGTLYPNIHAFGESIGWGR